MNDNESYDAELEAYKKRKEDKANRVPIDDGYKRMRVSSNPDTLDKPNKQKKKAGRKAIVQATRGSLNSSNMHYHNDEKFIQSYYRDKFVAKIISEKGEMSIVDEMIIDLLAYCAVRIFRKSRLESMFGRFMDRTAPQDPVAQILSCIKSLGLRNNLKGGESGKELISKILGSDAEEMNNIAPTLTFEEWKEAEAAKGGISRIQRRSTTDFGEPDDFYKTPEEIGKEESMNDVGSEMPTFDH